MAREYGKVWFSMLTDEHFTTQPTLDKLLYITLLAQPSLNYAGVTPFHFKRWGKACRHGQQVATERDLQSALVRLERQQYVYSDDDTGEVLVRSFIRNDQIAKQPNVLLSALRSLAQIESPKLCAVMLEEIQRVPMPEVTGDKPHAVRLRQQLAETRLDAVEHLSAMSEGLSEPFPEPFGEPFLEGLSRPAEIEPFSKGFREPFGEPPVVVEVEVAKSPSVVGYVGGTHARSANGQSNTNHDSDAPPPRCPKHLDNPTDSPCRACGIARQRRETWDREDLRLTNEAKADEHRRRAEAVRAERANCPLGCATTDGYINGRVCDHNPDQADTNRRGIALVRSALPKNGTDS